jgi:hypothetical protein
METASEPEGTTTNDPNRHVLDYLEYYCKPDNSFDFAVLLKGSWGAGKTFLIKHFLEERPRSSSDGKDLYVSLYGVTSLKQIDENLFREAHPNLSSKGARIFGEVARRAVKTAYSVDMDLPLQSYFDPPRKQLLIFDDLERCSISIPDTLGYINHFVEHRECKVIILANEDEILKFRAKTIGEAESKNEPEARTYKNIKEKLVGQTLTVNSTPNSAFSIFVAMVTDKNIKTFLSNNKDTILLLHSQSGTNNLRLLKHALWDFERFGACLSTKHWSNNEVVQILLRILLVLSFETRSGRLAADRFDELKVSRFVRYMKSEKDGDQTIVDELEKRYPEVDFDQTIIDVDLFKELLFGGLAVQTTIQDALNRSTYFAPPGSLPAWKTALEMWHIDDDSFEEAVASIEKQFENREFENPGEMFHVFGLRLLFAEMGAIFISKEEVLRQCKAYVDAIRRSNMIINKYTEGTGLDRSMSWDGIRFVRSDTAEFREILSYYNNIIDEVAKHSLTEYAQNLLVLMERNPDQYAKILSFSPGVYYNVPILARIVAKDFVDAVLKLDVNSQATVLETFRSRYEPQLLDNELIEEKKNG